MTSSLSRRAASASSASPISSSAREMAFTASAHRNSAAYASATSSAISALSPGLVASRSASSRCMNAASRPALASARAVWRRSPIRSLVEGGSASARFSRAAAVPGAPLSAASCAASAAASAPDRRPPAARRRDGPRSGQPGLYRREAGGQRRGGPHRSHRHPTTPQGHRG